MLRQSGLTKAISDGVFASAASALDATQSSASSIVVLTIRIPKRRNSGGASLFSPPPRIAAGTDRARSPTSRFSVSEWTNSPSRSASLSYATPVRCRRP